MGGGISTPIGPTLLSVLKDEYARVVAENPDSRQCDLGGLVSCFRLFDIFNSINNLYDLRH